MAEDGIKFEHVMAFNFQIELIFIFDAWEACVIKYLFFIFFKIVMDSELLLKLV